MRQLYQIGLVGVTQSGKSSLANCLLLAGLPPDITFTGNGRGPLPTGPYRTTALPTCVCFGNEAVIEAHFFDSNPVSWTWDQYAESAVEQTEETETQRTISELLGFIMRLPAPICRAGVCIVDTPGIQEDDWRREVTRDIISRSNLIIVVHRPESVILGAASPWTLLQHDISGVSRATLFHVVNSSLSEAKFELRQRVRRVLLSTWQDQDLPLDECLKKNRIYFVDIRQASTAIRANDSASLSTTGFWDFQESLKMFLDAELRRSQQDHFHKNRLSPLVLARVKKLLEIRDNANNLSKLLSSLRAGGVVPFVGAGLSVAFNFPSWRDFLLSLATSKIRVSVEQYLSHDQYEDAAEFLFAARTESAFTQQLEFTFGAQPDLLSVKKAAAYLLPDIFPGPLITTNYDRVLETVYSARGQHLDVVVGAKADVAMKSIADRRPFLLKIHGDVETRFDRIICKAHYKEIYDIRGDLPRLLLQLFSGHPHLFLGCSLNKDRMFEILREARGSTVPHFALLQDIEDSEYEERQRQLDSAGVFPIWFPKGEFDSIAIILEYLKHHGK